MLTSFLEKINPLDKNSASPVEYYLCLLVNDKKVKSAIWAVPGKEEDNIVFGASESWGNNNPEELIVAADASIASAVTKLSSLEGKQPDKVILGIPESWVQENSIEQSKQNIFTQVCKKMELRPIGFIVTPEAISHYLKNEEGGLPSFILVNIGETEITVSLILKGKFLGSKVVGRSDSLALDLEEGLLRFDIQDNLPNRILLIDDLENQNIEEARQTLVAYPWVGPEGEKKLNFLQLPKVEIADPNFEIKAVVQAGFREVRPEELGEEKESLPVDEITSKEVTSEETDEDFGFIKGEDVLTTGSYFPENIKEKEEQAPEPEETTISESVGTQIKKKKSAFLFLKKIPMVFSWFKKIKLPRLRFGLELGKVPFLAVGTLLIFISLTLFSFWNWARAEVRIFVEPQKVFKEFEFTASSEVEEVDSQKMLVPARKLTHQVSGSKTAEVTGKKTIGDMAKGEIIIYNRTEQTKKISKGSVLKGPGGLKFTVDEDITIASKTADLAMGVDKWGEAKTTATAADIGAQYNIAADSVLSFETISSSSLLIKNPSAFSGGTSREIQAVSEADREGLQKALLSELRETARLEMVNLLSDGDFLLEDSLVLESKSSSFDREVGEEASSLSLEVKADFSANYIEEEDFLTLTEEVLLGEINEGYRRVPSSGDRTFSLIDAKQGVYEASIREEFIPEIDVSAIVLQLKGKPIAKGEKTLKNLSRVNSVNINVSPKPFFYLKFFPFKEQNISVSIETLE